MSATLSARAQRDPDPPAQRRSAAPWQDWLFEHTTMFFAVLVLALLLGILLALGYSAVPAFNKFGFGFFVTDVWNPVTSQFGALAPIYGTLVTSAVALAIGVPVSFGIALFLTEMCPAALKRPLGTAVELLAAIPSIIYGMWGLFVFAPLFGDYIQPLLQKASGNLWILGPLFQGAPNGIGMLSVGIILSVMIIPFISSVMRDVFEIVPPVLRVRVWHRLHDVGSGLERGAAVYEGRCGRRHHAGFWRSARRWRLPSSSATPTGSALRCSRPATRSPPPSPTSSTRPRTWFTGPHDFARPGAVRADVHRPGVVAHADSAAGEGRGGENLMATAMSPLTGASSAKALHDYALPQAAVRHRFNLGYARHDGVRHVLPCCGFSVCCSGRDSPRCRRRSSPK
jgi:hypothetical protein